VRAYWLVPAVIVAGLALVVFDQKSGLPAWFRLRDDLSASQARIAILSARGDELRHEIEALERDPFELERAIREELGLARPGERIIRFEEPIPTD
jgi:cell division protein FtsB